MTVAIAIFILLNLKLLVLLLLLFNHTNKYINMFPFISRFGHSYCSGHSNGYGYGSSFTTFKNWIMSVLESGSTGKYQHSVSGIPLGCALRNSLDLMLVFPCTPLLSSRYRLSTGSISLSEHYYTQSHSCVKS